MEINSNITIKEVQNSDELKEFVRMVEEGRVKHKFDALSSLESLKVVEGLFKSDETGKRIEIERNERHTF